MKQDSLGAVVSPVLVGMRASVQVITGPNPKYDGGLRGRFLFEECFGGVVAAIPTTRGTLNLHILLDDGTLQVRELGGRRSSGVRMLPADFVTPQTSAALPPLNSKCSVCHQRQFNTPSGATCPQGHGADGVPA